MGLGFMQMLFWRTNFEDGNCPNPGLFAAWYLQFPGRSLITCVKPVENYLVFDPQTGTKFQIDSQGKLTMLRCKNRKIRHKTKFKKQMNGSIRCMNSRSIEYYQKYVCKSGETFPLRVYSISREVLAAITVCRQRRMVLEEQRKDFLVDKRTN
jgi:hypothetical protein